LCLNKIEIEMKLHKLKKWKLSIHFFQSILILNEKSKKKIHDWQIILQKWRIRNDNSDWDSILKKVLLMWLGHNFDVRNTVD